MQVSASRLQAALRRCWPGLEMPGLAAETPLRLELDSRRVAPGDVFVAVPGVAVDGRRFLDQALAAGARWVLYHLEASDVAEGMARHPQVIGLPFLRQRLGELGQYLFEVPETLEVIGVTGTNGKSSVTHYLAELSLALGRDSGVLGTLGHGRPGALTAGALTTPGPLALQAALGTMARDGMSRIAMEVSSHALDQGRLDGCRITAGVFTNLSRDHLDYHGSMAAYAAAKARLFRRPELSLAVVNADDPLARLMLAGVAPGVRVLAVGNDPAATLRVAEWTPRESGQVARVATPEGDMTLALSLMGRFNLDNVLIAIATLYGLGSPLTSLFEAAARLTPVPGRMQRLPASAGPGVVVDYAHTPDALENALTALRAHLPGGGRLWCLFGCGGDRDAGKRPLMAAVAARHADRIVVTDDNPRSEPPDAIRQQILAGLPAEVRAEAWEIGERGEAIARVVAEAAAGDVVLIAGKGHENYQEIGGTRQPYCDVSRANEALERRRGGSNG
ncbi:UDP-N-acetylmuramoyl-L-alanyl-D-glutamate--2,6-diaminopimelate ligase [Halomonas sp. E19]|uniref:UDP-N-acetylmuramoyl-L-alanyl-D-glutamate--2, 6-diaminopimelate ligase n=1 Tax=Halomonas sp. E19 TaxID=3397247 RepID=UPI0040340B46